MLPILERELGKKRDWVTGDQLLDYYAIGQSTPGIIAVNVATFIGYNRCGLAGGVVATAGIVAPSIIVITLLALFLRNFTDIVWVRKALGGINVAVAALLTQAVWQFGKKSVKNIWGFLILAAAFVSMYFFGVNSVAVIAVSAALGIAASFTRSLKSRREDRS